MVEGTDSLQQVVDTLGVNSFIWIDDDFADGPSATDPRDKLLIHIQSLLDAQEQGVLHEVEEFKEIDITVPKEVIHDEISSLIQKTSDDAVKEIVIKLDLSDSEYTEENIEVIKASVESAGVDLKTFSFKSWQEEKENYNELDTSTLFLIDLEFTKEGAPGKEGIELLKEILQKYKGKPIPPCILFTHTCGTNKEEEEERSSIFQGFIDNGEMEPLQSSDFQVLSKRAAFDHAGNHSRLICSIRSVFVRKIFAQMAFGLSKKIVSHIDNMANQLIQANVYEMDNVIFGSSLREGSSELELLHRIFTLSQRQAVSSFIEAPIVEDLIKLRGLNSLSAICNNVETLNYEDFKEIRRTEFWLDGIDLNKIKSPISCGDVFKSGRKEYLLISQPCDTQLRSTGKRSNNIAILAPLRKKNHSTKAPDEFKIELEKYQSKIYCFALQEIRSEQIFWVVEFNKSIAVNTDVLDLCTFNETGSIEFEASQEKPELIYLDGQVSRFKKFKELAKENPPDNFPINLCLEPGIFRKDLSGLPTSLTFDEANQKWGIELVRDRRLLEPFAEHVLEEFFAYKARTALEHDFMSTA